MSKSNIGANISLNGESEFRKAVSSINNDMRVLGSEMKKVTSEFSGNEKSIESLTAKNKVLNDQIETQKEKIEAVRKALENSKDLYGENSENTKKWQITLNNAESDLNKLNNEVKDNKIAMEKAQNPTTELASDVKNLGKDMDKASNSTNDFKDKLKGGLVSGLKTAAVGFAGLAATAAAAAIKMGVEVIKSFGELEQNLGGSESVFGKYAKSIQKSGEDAYKNLGVSQSEYHATANKMGALFQGSGIEQQKSLDLTEKAMQRAADMASVMGIDMSMAMESVAGCYRRGKGKLHNDG